MFLRPYINCGIMVMRDLEGCMQLRVATLPTYTRYIGIH